MTSDEAFELGAEYGRDRASWVFDSALGDETYRAFLEGYNDGDPQVMDAYDHGFSIGEWAGESNVELGIEGFEDEFLNGYDMGYWNELVSTADRHVNGERS